MNLKSTFYIKIFIDGSQHALMDLEYKNLDKIKEVEHLASGHLSKSIGVKKELIELEKVLAGKNEIHSFGGDDWCIVDFRKEKSLIISGFDKFEAFEISSIEIYNLLNNWYKFLIAYENSEIPGIIPTGNSYT